jgi:hypothetical protein
MTRKTLLEELDRIDIALLNGTTTAKQEGRGQEIVHLLDAAQDLLFALEAAEEQLANYCLSEKGRDIEAHRTLRKAREAIALATASAP